MKIAILTSGILPIPAVQGGAVENLIDFYLDYNDRKKLHDITVFSISDKRTKGHKALLSDVNHYRYINTNSIYARIRKKIDKIIHKKHGYYDVHIEYFIKKVSKEIKKEKFDIIIMENRPGFVLHFNKDYRIIYHLHNDNLNSKCPNSKIIYNLADRIICVSDYICKCVQTIENNCNKVLTVYNGIDVSYFKKKDFNLNRDSLGLKENDFVVCFIGRIIPDKGIRQLLEAMLLLREYKQIKLLIIGSSFLGCKSGNSHFLEQLNEMVEPIQSNIHFTGYINYNKVPAYLHLADIAVVPSVWEEPFGLTCIEALAAGLPLITTAKGGIPEVVNQECAEILCADNSLPQSLANSILALYNNEKRRQQMSKAAVEHACCFDKDEYSNNFFKAIEQ